MKGKNVCNLKFLVAAWKAFLFPAPGCVDFGHGAFAQAVCPEGHCFFARVGRHVCMVHGHPN